MNRSLIKIHYAWIVAAVTFLALIVSAAVRSAPGILIVPLEQEFGWSRATISLAVSVNLLLYGLIGPFAAGLINRYGLRKGHAAGLHDRVGGRLLDDAHAEFEPTRLPLGRARRLRNGNDGDRAWRGGGAPLVSFCGGRLGLENGPAFARLLAAQRQFLHLWREHQRLDRHASGAGLHGSRNAGGAGGGIARDDGCF